MDYARSILNNIPGLLLVFTLSLLAFFAGKALPIIGGPVFGIIFGILLSNKINTYPSLASGISFSSRKILQLSIILLGATLSLSQIGVTSVSSLYIMLCTISGAFAAAYFFGKLLGISSSLRNLIGVGTAICGGSAIAAVSSVTKNDEHDIAYAISTIFLFNVVAVLIFPPLGHVLGLTQDGFGLFAGTAINDTSSVLAAGYIYGDRAGEFATIVKLTRTTLIIPISIAFAVHAHLRSPEKEKKIHVFKIVPVFIILFVFTSVLNSLGLIPPAMHVPLKETAKFMIIMALCAIGLRTNFAKMKETGLRPLFLGLIVWITVSGISLLVQYCSGRI